MLHHRLLHHCLLHHRLLHYCVLNLSVQQQMLQLLLRCLPLSPLPYTFSFTLSHSPSSLSYSQMEKDRLEAEIVETLIDIDSPQAVDMDPTLMQEVGRNLESSFSQAMDSNCSASTTTAAPIVTTAVTPTVATAVATATTATAATVISTGEERRHQFGDIRDAIVGEAAKLKNLSHVAGRRMNLWPEGVEIGEMMTPIQMKSCNEDTCSMSWIQNEGSSCCLRAFIDKNKSKVMPAPTLTGSQAKQVILYTNFYCNLPILSDSQYH